MPSYNFHPEVWILVAFCAALGFYISRVLATRLPKLEITRRQKTAYVAAIFFLWAASDWPLHDLSEDYLYFIHMIQHLLITFVVPPLLLIATPEPLARTILGSSNKAWLRLTHPIMAGLMFNILVALTHLPWSVNTAAENGIFHYSVHTVLFFSAILMWMPVCSPLKERRLSLPTQMVYLFMMSILPTIPAGFLTFAESSIYEAYTGAFGIAPQADQQAAGLVMKIVGGFYLWAIIGFIFFRWSSVHQKTETVARQTPRQVSSQAPRQVSSQAPRTPVAATH